MDDFVVVESNPLSDYEKWVDASAKLTIAKLAVQAAEIKLDEIVRDAVKPLRATLVGRSLFLMDSEKSKIICSCDVQKKLWFIIDLQLYERNQGAITAGISQLRALGWPINFPTVNV